MSKSLFGFGLALAATVLIGCGDDSSFEEYDTAPTSDGTHGGHSHEGEAGPHGGSIVELASDHSVHGEACLDEGGKSVTFYILGGDLKSPMVAESLEFEIDEGDDEKHLPVTPKPLDGETDGKASAFVVDTSSLGVLENLDHLHAHVHVVIDGQEYEGAVAGDHDHDAHGEGHEDHADGDDHDHDDHAGHDGDDDHGHDDDHDHDHADDKK